ncbi:MAG: hypothetical protein M1826_002149 [Phylliscum demangeonii]|nr:MAG: hypothetical protein M1826_002149 [Phylliscum demangeonii]
MCTTLLGIIYEFSTKDSPIARSTIHQIITSRLGREQYISKLTKLREHPSVRDFEVLHQGLSDKPTGGLPNVLFDEIFVYFFKDNFNRLLRAIDRDPAFEIPVVTNGIQKGISRELVDSLRIQVEDKTQALAKCESEILTFERRLGQEQAEHRRAKETAAVELSRIRLVNESLQRNHEDDVDRLRKTHTATLEQLQDQHRKELDSAQNHLRQYRQEEEDRGARVRARNEAETAELKATVHDLEGKMFKSNAEHLVDLQTAHEEYSAKLASLETRVQRAEARAEEADRRALENQKISREAQAATADARVKLEETRKAREGTQSELDDLLILLGDLEEKRARDKKRLKALGESVSDGSDEEEGDVPAADDRKAEGVAEE